MTKTSNREKQLRYLSQSIRLKEATNPRLIRMTMFTISLSIMAFISWSAYANVYEVAHTPGEIVPTGFQRTVQHFDGGIVRDILVNEGQQVAKGQVLIRLDGAGVMEDLSRARDKKQFLSLQEERLRAFIDGREPDFKTSHATPEHLADQNAFFKSMNEARKKEAAIIGQQIRQKRQSITVLSSDLETAQSNYQIAEQLLHRRIELNQKGIVSDVKLMETQRNHNNLKGQIKNLENQIAMAQTAIREYQTRLSSLNATHKDEAHQRLDTVTAEMKQIEDTIKKLENRAARLEIKAPLDGLVKGLAVNTIGNVVQPGQTLMELVPIDTPLIVNLKIPPQYVGRLRTGQTVQVKVSSFDFSRYGSVAGKLDYISPTTFAAQNGERFYEGRVKLDQPYVGSNPQNKVVPGMTVMADIITGEKTVLQYLLKPIRNAMSTSFTEQ